MIPLRKVPDRVPSPSSRRFSNPMRYVFATTKRRLAAGAARITLVERAVRGLDVLVAGTVLLLFLLIVTGATAPVSAADPLLPAFGEGAVEVRVHTDYFCGPCRAEEQEVIALITELVERNRIRVIFIDTPLYPETVLYAGYFLAAVNAKREFGQAIAARAALFEAAGMQINEKGALETFLKKKGVAIQPLDTAPIFKIFSNYIKENRINSTPTLVISGPGGKQILGNKEQILKALSDLRK
jgi:thiol-disulfide isomerase/thioredoxin